MDDVLVVAMVLTALILPFSLLFLIPQPEQEKREKNEKKEPGRKRDTGERLESHSKAVDDLYAIYKRIKANPITLQEIVEEGIDSNEWSNIPLAWKETIKRSELLCSTSYYDSQIKGMSLNNLVFLFYPLIESEKIRFVQDNISLFKQWLLISGSDYQGIDEYISRRGLAGLLSAKREHRSGNYIKFGSLARLRIRKSLEICLSMGRYIVRRGEGFIGK